MEKEGQRVGGEKWGQESEEGLKGAAVEPVCGPCYRPVSWAPAGEG